MLEQNFLEEFKTTTKLVDELKSNLTVLEKLLEEISQRVTKIEKLNVLQNSMVKSNDSNKNLSNIN